MSITKRWNRKNEVWRAASAAILNHNVGVVSIEHVVDVFQGVE